MDKVTSYEQITDWIIRIRNLKQGYITNFYLEQHKIDLLLERDTLYAEFSGDVLLLIKHESEFSNLYYCASEIDALKARLSLLLDNNSQTTFVFDIVGNKMQCNNVISSLSKCGLSEYVSLVRMSRKTPASNDVPPVNIHVKIASVNHAFIIHEMLHSYFDAMAEQLPYLPEIEEFIEKGNVLVYEEGDCVLGFVIYEINTTTLYLRYWFVHPEHRDKKIGSALLNAFFYQGRATKRHLFWVIKSNENAIKRYMHYGFQEENMYNFVLTNRNIKYEEKGFTHSN